MNENEWIDLNEWLDGMKDGGKKQRAIAFALEWAPTDGSHHKQWTIDQMLRILTGRHYDHVIEYWKQLAREDTWDEGTAP